MYQPNLQNIIRKLQEALNNKAIRSFCNKLVKGLFVTKSTRDLSGILSPAALAVFCILLAGCEDPGNVGSRFVGDEADLETKTLPAGAFDLYPENGFSGNLRYMPIGRYDDPLFGEFTAIGILRPSIDTTRVDAPVEGADLFQLRLVFGSQVYGDTTGTASYDIYRLNGTWRGNELRFGDDIPLDESQKIGEFSVEGRDTVTVELDESWVGEYNEFLVSGDDDREERYRQEFPGLAIVPSDGNSKVLFADMRPSDTEDENDMDYVRFVAERDDEEGTVQYQTVFDWGSLNSRSEPDNPDDHLTPVHNSYDYLISLEPDLNEETLGSRNLASVRLMLFQNQDLLESSLPANHVRPGVNQLGIHIIDSENVSERIFSHPPDFIASLDSTDGSYRFDITDRANSVLFNNSNSGDNRFFISLQANGLIYSTLLFNQDAPDEDVRPKIKITAKSVDK
ncbi:MAG: hypothetical protein WEC12_04720 [Balneolaceae bacterium]